MSIVEWLTLCVDVALVVFVNRDKAAVGVSCLPPDASVSDLPGSESFHDVGAWNSRWLANTVPVPSSLSLEFGDEFEQDQLRGETACNPLHDYPHRGRLGHSSLHNLGTAEDFGFPPTSTTCPNIEPAGDGGGGTNRGPSLSSASDFDRALRLLRSIHRPHNCYCVHVDRKTRKKYRDVFEEQVRKLYGPEVFLVPFENTTVVTWGRLSVLESDLLCSRMLLERCPSWLYWINLTGHEFPLRTNWELVTALKLLNGSNAIEATLKSRYSTRLPTSHDLPFQFTWYTGSVHIVARREFVDYIHNNPKAIHLLNVLRHHELTRNVRTITDETFFSTLNHNPDTFPVPGAFLGEHEPKAIKSVARYKVWDWQDKPCGTGYWVRRICMLGLKDLPSLQTAPEFFANKFIVSVEPEAYDKLEQWISEKVDPVHLSALGDVKLPLE
ncbi:Core-2/I-Branching enzyme, partial [Opisthorchis viverrini]